MTQQTNSPPPGTPVLVDVYADDDGGGGVRWSHSWKFQGSPSSSQGRIDIPAGKPGDPATPIHFQLRDRTGIGLGFATDPIWVARDPRPCPRAAESDPEITVTQRTPPLLRVTDRNQDECVLRYNLRFDPDPQRYFYDPEIRNGGGN